MSKETDNELFKYRDKIEIPKLGYVDDVVDVNKCGKLSKELNERTNSEYNKRNFNFIMINVTGCM